MPGGADDVADNGPEVISDEIADSVAAEVVAGNLIEILVEEKPVQRRGRPKKVPTKRGRYDRKSKGLTKEKASSSSIINRENDENNDENNDKNNGNNNYNNNNNINDNSSSHVDECSGIAGSHESQEESDMSGKPVVKKVDDAGSFFYFRICV